MGVPQIALTKRLSEGCNFRGRGSSPWSLLPEGFQIGEELRQKSECLR